MAAPASGVLHKDYVKAFTRAAAQWEGIYELTRIGTARSVPRAAPLLRLASLGKRKGGLMLMAGFHGEEPAGPMTLLHFMHHILGRAADLKVPLCIYPVVNPHGFDLNKRTTVDGSFTNAGFIHELDGVGQEVASLRKDMMGFAPDIFLDLHEDDHEERAYLYAFGDPKLAARLVSEEARFLPIARGPLIHTHHLAAQEGVLRDLHDGSAEDFMSHAGTRGSFASETPANADLKVRMAVDLALVDACLDDIVEHRAKARRRASR